MLEAVILGLAGVLQKNELRSEAELASVAQHLEAEGILQGPAPYAFAALARANLQQDARAPFSSALQTLRIRVPVQTLRTAIRKARQAVPDLPISPGQKSALQAIRSRFVLAFLDEGEPERMEKWFDALGLGDLGVRRLWTGSLGRQARAPSPLAFRWLGERLDLRPSECLYVAGSSPLHGAARKAGWRVRGPYASPVDLVDLMRALEEEETPVVAGAV